MNKKTVGILAAVGILLLLTAVLLMLKGCNTDGSGSQTRETSAAAQTQSQEASTAEQSQATPEDTDESKASAQPGESTEGPGNLTVEMGISTDRGADGETVASTGADRTHSDAAGGGENIAATQPQPSQTTAPTQPEGESTGSTEPPAAAAGTLTYEQYLALSDGERMAYYLQFADDEAFVQWFHAAKEAYDKKNAIEIGGGSVDLGDILNP